MNTSCLKFLSSTCLIPLANCHHFHPSMFCFFFLNNFSLRVSFDSSLLEVEIQRPRAPATCVSSGIGAAIAPSLLAQLLAAAFLVFSRAAGVRAEISAAQWYRDGMGAAGHHTHAPR